MAAAALSFAQSIAAQAARDGIRTAVWFEQRSFSYRQLADRVHRAYRRLVHQWCVASGARVAFLGANHLDCLTLLAACEHAQAVYCPLNFRLAPAELASILNDAQPAVLLADAAHLTLARSLAANSGCACYPIEALTAPDGDSPVPAPDGQDRDVLLVYTSGTTGRPKGVVHAVHAMAANMVASAAGQALQRDDVVLCSLPMFHVGGLCIQTLPAIASGAQIVLHPRFDASAWLEAVAAHRVTQALMVPATMRAVIEHAFWPAAQLHSLRAIAAGSSTIPISLIQAFHARSIAVMQVYGSTETGPTSTVLPREAALVKEGCAGWPAHGVQIQIDAPSAQGVGQVRVRGPNLMRGYFGAAQGALDAQGWFGTGDLGRLDQDGALWIMGRAKDMLISGGENVYPAELENVLAGMAAVAQAAVVGVPDPRWGEVPVACVVVRPDMQLDAASVLAAFEGRLARFKHPKLVVFLDDLPKNAMGKVEKAHLVKIVAALQASSAPR